MKGSRLSSAEAWSTHTVEGPVLPRTWIRGSNEEREPDVQAGEQEVGLEPQGLPEQGVG